jgi:hypothetical protein
VAFFKTNSTGRLAACAAILRSVLAGGALGLGGTLVVLWCLAAASESPGNAQAPVPKASVPAVRAASIRILEDREAPREEPDDDAYEVPGLEALRPGQEDPAAKTLVAGIPMRDLARGCAPAVHPSVLMHLARRASRFEPWSVGNPGGVFYAAQSRNAAEDTMTRLNDEGVNATVGLLQIPARLLWDEGVNAGEALDPCVNLAAGARLLLRLWRREHAASPEAPKAALAMTILAFERMTGVRPFALASSAAGTPTPGPSEPEVASEDEEGDGTTSRKGNDPGKKEATAVLVVPVGTDSFPARSADVFSGQGVREGLVAVIPAPGS